MKYLKKYKTFENDNYEISDIEGFLSIMLDFIQNNNILKLPEGVYKYCGDPDNLGETLDHLDGKYWSFIKNKWHDITNINDPDIKGLCLYNTSGRNGIVEYLDSQKSKIENIGFKTTLEFHSLGSDKYDVVVHLEESECPNPECDYPIKNYEICPVCGEKRN